jgi:NADH-quinone oxidoreductase subunit L
LIVLGALLLAAESAEAAATTGGWFLRNAWLIPLIPALSFVLILFLGKRTPGKGAPIGIIAVSLSLVLSLGAAVQWIQHVNDASSHGETEHALSVDASGHPVLAAEEAPAEEGEHAAEGDEHAAEGGEEHASVDPVHSSTKWFEINGHEIRVGTLVDGLAVMMLLVVTSISLLVHIYSTDYVAGDRRYTHFFAFLSLFTASMLLLVLADNTLMLICAWELVGVCSFALIGHWWEEKANSDAALKAFLTNRVGDMGLLVGVTILFWAAGQSFDIVRTNELAVSGGISHNILLAASCCLIAAVMSKSGQFFLHTWLPDAMAGPTPVSALIHAATMVVAGVFMIARLYGVFFEGFSIAGSSINLMALVGGITVLVGASLAFVQRDIKKVLAYSTISQLGYMVMALGVGAWTAALFHLFTHAFFKACLFLGSGSVSHSVHSFDMKSDMGGLKKYMPRTFWTFVIGSAALAGLFPLAGFWSKDEILVGTGSFAGTDGNGTYHAMLLMGMLGAALTAAYMTRVIYLTFFGEFRGHGHPHESGPRITIPLIILSGLAIVAGLANLPENFLGLGEGWTLRFEHYVEPVGGYFPTIAHGKASWLLAIISLAVALAGIAWSYAYYFGAVATRSRVERKQLTELPNGITTTFGPARAFYALLVNKYYLDKLYTDIIVGSIKGPIARAAYWFNQNVLDRTVDTAGTTSVKVGQGVYKYIDQMAIDGVVNGTGILSEQGGEELRHIQSGKVQQYAALLFGGATVLAGVFIIVLTA